MQARQTFSLFRFGLPLVVLSACVLALGEDAEDRRIERSDLIIVAVYDEPKLSGEFRVQAGGTIRYPLLGDIEAAGKTTGEVANDLTKKLGEDYLVNPEVGVTVKQYRTRTVTVIGKVMKPGPVPLLEEEPMDIIQALAYAQGFQPTANQGKILFTRKGKTTVYRMKDLRKITDEKKKVWLEPDDIIEVKESTF